MTAGVNPLISGASTPTERQWHGIYNAIIVNTNDPLSQGRVQLQIPQVLGNAVSNWAVSQQTGITVPAVGTQVYVQFLGGNPNHPLWFIGLSAPVVESIINTASSILNTNAFFVGGDLVGWTGVNGTIAPIQPNTNPPFPFAIELTCTGAGAFISEQPAPITVVATQHYQALAWVYFPVGGSVSIGMGFNVGGNVTNTFVVAANTWTMLTTVITAPAGATLGWPLVGPTSSSNGMLFFGEAIQIQGQIPGSLLQDGTVGASKIQAGTIVAGIVDTTTIDTVSILGYSVNTQRGPYSTSFEYAPVQTVSNSATTGSITVTLNQATTAGNCLVACVSSSHSSISSITVGGLADHWASASSVTDGGSNIYSIWTDQNCAGGQSTVTVNISASTNLAVTVYELSGINASSAVDKTATGSGATTGTFTTSATATTSQAVEVAIGMVGMFAGSTPVITELVYTDTSVAWGGVGTMMSGFDVLTSTQTEVYTGTMSPNATDYGACVITLKLTMPSTGWTAQSSTISVSNGWSSDQQTSLKIICNGSANPGAVSPNFSTAFMDSISLTIDVFSPTTTYNNMTLSINYYDISNTLLGTTTNGPNVITAGAVFTTIQLLDTVTFASVDHFNYSIYDAATDTVNHFFYVDNTTSAGNLAYSASATAGTDDDGNPYDQGVSVIAVDGLTNAYSVIDPFGNTLGTLDTGGNISGQTLSATSDIVLGGDSLVNTTFPTFSQGVLNTGYIPAGSLPFGPITTGSGTKVAILELDVTIPTDRSCQAVIAPTVLNMTTGTTGVLFLYLYYTTDGSAPNTTGTGSTVFATQACSGPKPSGTAFTGHPGFTWDFNTLGVGSDTLYRFLVVGFIDPVAGSGISIVTPMQTTVIDVGDATLQNTGQNATVGGGASKQTYTTKYYPVHTYTYSSGGVLRNTDGPLNEGSSSGHFFFLDYSSGNTMSTDLAGATINWCKLFVHNTFSYFSGGCNLELWANSHGHTGNYNSGRVTLGSPKCFSGQSVRINLSTAVATNFQNGTYNSFQIGPGPGGNNNYNASFQGPSGNDQPYFVVNYTK